MSAHSTEEEFPKKEQTLFEKIDGVLRDKDTAFARLLEAVSPEKGEEYLNSKLKRFLDLSIAVSAAIISTPVIAVLGIAKKLEDGGTAFFIQERYQKIPNQVVLGQLSAIGVRPLPSDIVKRLSSSSEEKEPSKLFNEWGLAYGAGRKGLTGLQQVRGIGKRIPGERFHYDIFYTKNAILGLDLYLLWATLGRILGTYPRRKSRAKEVKE